MLVTGGSDEVIIWEPGSLKELHRSSGRQGKIPSRSTVTFSPDGRMAAIPLQTDGRIEVKVWDAGALRENGFQQPPVSVLQRGDTEFPVNGMVFSKQAEVLATGQVTISGNSSFGILRQDGRSAHWNRVSRFLT